MSQKRTKSSEGRPRFWPWLLALLALAVACGASGAQAQQPRAGGVPGFGARGAPSANYYFAFRTYYEGDYDSALRSFRSELRGAIKNPTSRWIDSICYHTMTGECYYQMGKYPEAVEHYSAALELYVAFNDWLIPVRFDPNIRPEPATQRVQVPWAATQRRSLIGSFATSNLIAQGRINNNEQVRQGGVVSPPLLFPISTQEIVRCTALAMRRRGELLGPVGHHDQLTKDVEATAVRRRGQPNHWSEVYLDVQLGFAYVASGKDPQAKNVLERSVLAAGEFDHPLTAMVLYELARIARDEGDLATAASLYLEASISAVQFEDYGTLEEALRQGCNIHIVSNQPGLYPPLEPAANWARVKDYRQLQASLLLCASENQAVRANPQAAQTLLSNARSVIGRRDMSRGLLGAKANYMAALVGYQAGNQKAGDEALNAALSFQQAGGSRWLYQVLEADSRYARGNISSRTAVALYAELLLRPTPRDWSFEPLEALTAQTANVEGAMDRWLEVALERREFDAALEITDLSRRRRFFATLPLGGRLLGLRWLLAGPPEALDGAARLERQDVLTRFPRIDQLLKEAAEIEAAQRRLPLVAVESETVRAQREGWKRLAEVSDALELSLREVAISRVPATLVFPPQRSVAEIRENLPAGQAVLAFYQTARKTYGFFVSAEGVQVWPVPGPAQLQRDVTSLLRELGNVDANRRLDLETLSSEQWKATARDLLRTLLEGSQIDFVETIQELAIVPDGLLWYVPFEALQLGDEQQSVALIERLRVRYAPTVGLAVPDGRGRGTIGTTAVVLGKLYPRDGDGISAEAFDELQRVVPGATALSETLATSPDLLIASIDRLVAYDDISTNPEAPYGWSPIQLGSGSRGALDSWLTLPLAGPELVVLPGFHTAAENGLKTAAKEGHGRNVFLSVCGVMASGARTVLITRWRPGGRSSYDLVREFLRELPHTTAADAWQRSVEFVSQLDVDPEREPRIDLGSSAQPPKARHPLFWSAFMLIDSGTPPRKEDADPAAGIFLKFDEPAVAE